jgi:hypothetical protein
VTFTPGAIPVLHDADLAILGSTPQARASDLPAGAVASVLHAGLDQSALALDPIGMTGCTAFTSVLVNVLPMTQTGSTASLSLGLVPNDPALLGGTMTTQVVTFVPGINPLQLVASNGWDWVFGDI